MDEARPPTLHVWTPRRPVGGHVSAVALVLHGGRAHSLLPTSRRQLAYLRMLPFDLALRRAGGRRGLAVARLRYRVRGWNDDDRSPVTDAREALAQLRARFGDVPVALVGHSMGGRAAIHVADEPGVEVVVALAPWIAPGDPVDTVGARQVLLMHGDADTRTDPRATAAFAAAARSHAARVQYVVVPHGDHAMLRRAGYWHRSAAAFVVDALARQARGTAPEPTGGSR